MGDPSLHDPDFVDLVFAASGQAVPADYGDALCHALRAALPWLEADDMASVLPLERTGSLEGSLCLSRHSRLVLRLAKARVPAALTLTGKVLAVGEGVGVGKSSLRPLAPAEVLHARLVSLGLEDENEFLAACAQALAAKGVVGKLVSGKARHVQAAGQRLPGFALMIHGLNHADSLRLQREGLGLERQRGCGVFVPHKSIAAVGE